MIVFHILVAANTGLKYFCFLFKANLLSGVESAQKLEEQILTVMNTAIEGRLLVEKS